MSAPSWRSERGSISVEVAVIAPAFVFLMLLVVYAGKVSEADGNVERAAAEGARAASLRQNPAAAIDDARAVVEANLAAAGVLFVSVLKTARDKGLLTKFAAQ